MSRRRKKRPFVKPVKNCPHCNGEGWERVEGKSGVQRCQCIKKQMDAILGGANLSPTPEELHNEYFRKSFGTSNDPPAKDGKSSAYKDNGED